MSQPLSDELHRQFLNLCCALSPENLCCDGELPAAEVERRHAKLMRDWQALEKIAKRKVTEDEIWQRRVASLRKV